MYKNSSARYMFFLSIACMIPATLCYGINVPARSGLVPKGDFILGVNGHPLGGQGVYTEDRGIGLAQQFGLIRELGSAWYRCDVFAREPDDELDKIVPFAEKKGVNIYPTLHPPIELRPYRTLPARMSTAEIYRKCFEAAKKAAKKWRGRIKVWDLSNEPDGWTIKGGNGDKKEHYDSKLINAAAAILKGQSDGIKAGDPEARVSLNTGGWLHYSFVDQMIERGVKFDILSWHWYDGMGMMDNVKKVGGFNLLAKLQEYGKPIWIGEMNARSIPSKGIISGYAPEANAWLLEIIRRLYKMRNYGVEAVFIYQLLDQPPFGKGNSEAHFGLVGVKTVKDVNRKNKFKLGERKPIFYEIQSWLTALRVEKMNK